MTILFMVLAVVMFLICAALAGVGMYMRHGKEQYDPSRKRGRDLLIVGGVGMIFVILFVLLALGWR